MAVITPSLSQVATNENWMRSQTYMDSLALEPEVDNRLYEQYGEQNFAVAGLAKTLGGVKYISNLQFRHATENFLHEVIQVGAYGAWGADTQATLTMSSDYHYTYPENEPNHPFVYGGAGTTVYPLYANQIIEFPDGTQAIVNAVTGASFTCYPKVAGEQIPATATTDIITILGNQQGGGADINPSRDTQWIWYYNNMMNSSWSYKMDGNTRAEKTWVEVDGGYVYYFKGQLNEMKRAKNEREMQIVTGQKTTSTAFATSTSTVNGVSGVSNQTNISFEGLIPFIENYGNIQGYNLISKITLQTWQNLVTTKLIPNMAAAEYMVYSAAKPMNFCSNWIMAEGKNGGITYGAMGDAKVYDTRDWETSGHSFHAKHYDVFDYVKLLGAPGHPYEYMMLCIPLDKADQTVDWNDMTETKNLPMFCVNYQQAPDGYSREFEEFRTGGVNGVYTTTFDITQVNARSTFGFEGFCPNRYAMLAKD